MEAESDLPQPTSSAADLPPQPYHPKWTQKAQRSNARPSDDRKRERSKNEGLEIGGKKGQEKQSDAKRDFRSGKQTIDPGAGGSISGPHTPSAFADSKRNSEKGGGKGRGTQEERSQSDEKGSRLRREAPSGKDRRTDKGVVSGASRPDSPSQSADVVRSEAHLPKPPRPGNRPRAPRFNPGLTVPDALVDPAPEENSTSAPEKTKHTPTDPKQRGSSEKRQIKPRPPTTHAPHVADDLTSTLIKSLSARPFADCPICFVAIKPNQPIWSCSPSTPQVFSTSDNDTTTMPQSCWTIFHLKCIRSWAEKSVKTLEEAWRNRGEMDKKGEWRCPGCQARRELVPTSYWCFCHSTPDPQPLRLATPHSCGNPCSRPRETGCGHACPLLCHPGPCPPCQVTMQVPCPCPRHQVVMFRCGDDMPGKGKAKEDRTAREKVVSCGNVCGRLLDCGKHSCDKICHTGACDACEVIDDAKCYCGRTNRLLGCGEGNALSCTIHKGVENETQTWIGRFECEITCDRLFDCGVHRCQKFCHPPSPDPATCPFSPNKITHCPCGKHAIAQDDSSSPPGEFTFSPRHVCTDPIPTCDSTCGKIQTLCGHECLEKCHLRPCPPCSALAMRPCRCGLTTKEVKCVDFITEEAKKELLCDRLCKALRACGHHECGRVCCPLASLAGKAKKGRVAAVGPVHTSGIGEEEGGLHECDLVCGKMLSCGNHTCERKDHKGLCPSCLRSTFEEVICPCGRTILDPPVPCGTKIECRYQCPRPTSCGHQPMAHTCHEVPPQCPLCAYLTTKLCACGKNEVLNVKCSLEREKISCATVCGSLLACGFHQCQRLCHARHCGACTAQCGKDRKLCLPFHHPCTRPCHAPSACPEDDPCEVLVTISCPCGRLTQCLRCGRSLSNPESSSSRVLKCNSDCELAKRNARLAEALGISDETRERANKHMAGGPVVYPDEVMSFARGDTKFVLLAEKTFAEFIASNKRSQVLPHMTQEKRKFVHSLAGIYRLDAQMVDQEPLRSIQILRRVDSRIPMPLLSASMTSSLGRLGLSSSSSSAWRMPSKPGSPAPVPPVPGITASGTRGWGAIVNPRSTGGTVSSTITTPAPRATNIPSRSATPSLGVRVESTPETQPRDENMDVPDNWEDDV